MGALRRETVRRLTPPLKLHYATSATPMGGEPLDNTWAQRTRGAIRSIKHWVTLGCRVDRSTKCGLPSGCLNQKQRIYYSLTFYFWLAASERRPMICRAVRATSRRHPRFYRSDWPSRARSLGIMQRLDLPRIGPRKRQSRVTAQRFQKAATTPTVSQTRSGRSGRTRRVGNSTNRLGAV